MILPVFHGWIPDGESFPHFDNEALEAMHKWCGTLSGKKVDMVIREQKNKRSNNQNAYYWGVVIKMIGDHCGYSTREELDGVHAELADMFLKVVKHGIDRDITVVRSTSSLTTQEFETYCADVRMWAAVALGMNIPEPNEVEIPEHYQGDAA